VLTGYSRQTSYGTLLAAPQGIRRGIVERVDREIALAEAGRPARVRIKVNSLVDEAVIDSLYRASRAGVEVDLVVRGICALRPRVPGLSERIRVRSIVGRFLEHSRVFHFGNGGQDEYWLGSADMMHRNLDRRVEVLVRIDSEVARGQLCDILDLATAPDISCWQLQPDGSWQRGGTPVDGAVRDLQTELMRRHTEHAD